MTMPFVEAKPALVSGSRRCGVALRRWSRIGFRTLILPWFGACHGEDTVASKVIGYNHTDKTIGTFTIQIGESEGGGGFLAAHRASGFSCCVGLPLPWHSGLTATVGWTDDYDENHQERVVPVPRYEAFNIVMVSVHFLRNGEIKVFVPPVVLGHPDYPLKGPEAGLYPGQDPINNAWRDQANKRNME